MVSADFAYIYRIIIEDLSDTPVKYICKHIDGRKRQDGLNNSQMHFTETVETTQESIKNIRQNIVTKTMLEKQSKREEI